MSEESAMAWLKRHAQALETGGEIEQEIASVLRKIRFAISIGMLPEFVEQCRNFELDDDAEDIEVA